VVLAVIFRCYIILREVADPSPREQDLQDDDRPCGQGCLHYLLGLIAYHDMTYGELCISHSLLSQVEHRGGKISFDKHLGVRINLGICTAIIRQGPYQVLDLADLPIVTPTCLKLSANTSGMSE